MQFWARRSTTEDPPPDGEKQLLPLPFSLPPERYNANDVPWMVDGAFTGLDSLGQPCNAF